MFVALALAMFGLYELQLPAALQSRLVETTSRLHGGHFAGVFSMGILSALIMGPCVAAPLAGALLAWAALLIVTAIFMRDLDPLPQGSHGFERFAKGVGVIARASPTGIAPYSRISARIPSGKDCRRPRNAWPRRCSS